MVTARRLVPAVLAAAACGSPPVEPEAPLARLDLRAAVGHEVYPVGVAVDATGQRFVFDEVYGLYRLDGATATQVMAMTALPEADVPFVPPFTDLVSIGPDRFAITAIGDGFILDLGAATLEQFFCYLPDDLPGENTQRTDAIAYDASAGLLFAQPLTFDSSGTLVGAQLAAYSSTSGVDLAWHTLPGHIAAGGMVQIPGGDLLVGSDRDLYRFADELTALDDLTRFGVTRIDGLALDGDRLLVVDRSTQALVELDLAPYR